MRERGLRMRQTARKREGAKREGERAECKTESKA